MRMVAVLAAALAPLLTGCAGAQAFAKYSHRSSIPEYRDTATSDTLGACVSLPLCASCGIYTPTIAGCVNWEVTGRPTYGRDPSGELEIRQPLKVWR